LQQALKIMTQISYRANLSAMIFPLTVAKAGKSVIIPGADQNFDRRIDAPGDTQRGSVGIPQVIYCENVFPTPDGIQSVGFKPQTSITIPASQSITAVTPVRIAIAEITEEIVTGGAITYSSTGNDLTSWEEAPDNIPPAADSGVEQRVIGNPGDNFSLYSNAADGGNAATYPWIRKSFAPGNPNNCGFEADFQGSGAGGGLGYDLQVFFGIFVNGSSAGLQIKVDFLANTVSVGTGTDIYGTGFSAIDSDTPSSTLTPGTWYRIEIVLTKVSADPVDQNRSFTVLLKSSGGATLATLTGFYAVTLGDYCTSSFVTSVVPGSTIGPPGHSFLVNIDNIEVSGDAPTTTTTYTEFTGLTTAYIAFFSDDTAKWSYDLQTWDNHEVTEPVGFQSPASPAKISVAVVRGVTYICIVDGAATKIYTATVDTGTNIITLVDISATIEASLPTPYDINSVLGITASYNYLILHTPNLILWSSTTTPTDFAPSLVSGAGNEVPGNLKGDITFCKEHLSGFFIYSTKNVVFAAYTGNQRYPWKFREVGASGGFDTSVQVSGDTNSAVQYGLNNTKFIQVLDPDSAEIVAPEVTDFLERVTRWDEFNSTTYAFSLSVAGRDLVPDSKPTIWFMLDRYLILPYGMSDAATNLQWTYGLVFDLVTKKYGKIKLTFDFLLSDEEGMYFINRLTGTIKRLYFDIHDQLLSGTSYKHEGVLVLGKFQLKRLDFLTIEEFTVETLQDTGVIALVDRQFAARILPTLDGKTFQTAVTPYRDTDASSVNTDTYKAHTTCQNFALVFKGAFDMNTVELSMQPEGDR
jgi:hypothetical protein